MLVWRSRVEVIAALGFSCHRKVGVLLYVRFLAVLVFRWRLWVKLTGLFALFKVPGTFCTSGEFLRVYCLLWLNMRHGVFFL